MRTLFSWLRCWEIYPILLVAGFLRLYAINTSEFDTDQAAIFGMARDALHFGLIPMTSNAASIQIGNPPAVVYLLMIPAAISADPLVATVMVGLLNTLAVLLTYLFASRYYGRIAGCVAALLYAAAVKPLSFSRTIWQQDMLAPFILLFLFFLFRGVVERRKGWFVPAVLLLGVMYQLHETAALLGIPLLIALVLAPGTIRWRRDLPLAVLALLVVFAPYIVWEVQVKFADVLTLIKLARLPSHIDIIALHNYLFLLSSYGFYSYNTLSIQPLTLLPVFEPVLFWLRKSLLVLLMGSFVTAGILVLWPDERDSSTPEADNSKGTGASSLRDLLAQLRRWWTAFRASPKRCGLALLLFWQVAPLVILSRHAIPLNTWYLLILMPGPFILIGFSIAQYCGKVTDRWNMRVVVVADEDGIETNHRQEEPAWRQHRAAKILRYSVYTIIAVVILAQVVTCTVALNDVVNGYNGHGRLFHDLASLEHALGEADQVAQQRHLGRVFVTTDSSSQSSLYYLSQQMHTPTVLFDDTSCLVLPKPADGPAVFLVSPYASVTLALLRQFSDATLIDQPPRLGSLPFQLYIVSPTTNHDAVAATFTDNLQLLGGSLQQVQAGDTASNTSWLVSRWNLLRTTQPNPRTTYDYVMTALMNNGHAYSSRSLCVLSAIQAGDQLLVAYSLSRSYPGPTPATLQVQSFMTTPDEPVFGPLHFETYIDQSTPWVRLQTTEGNDSISVLIE